jgi:hypothetical protein
MPVRPHPWVFVDADRQHYPGALGHAARRPMNVAFLFNSGDPKYDAIYGDPIRNTVFGLGIVQACNRHMKVAVGDVLIYGRAKTWAE